MLAMGQENELPPVGALIEERREQLGYSVRQAAERGHISPTWWTTMVANPDRAKARVLANMAIAVRLDPDELTKLGRKDAADVVYEYAARYANGRDATADTIKDDPRLTDEQRAVLLGVLDVLLAYAPRRENGSYGKRREA